MLGQSQAVTPVTLARRLQVRGKRDRHQQRILPLPRVEPRVFYHDRTVATFSRQSDQRQSRCATRV
jgi:hypothetical protein